MNMFLSTLLDVLRVVGWVLMIPIRLVLTVRRATTEASVSLLLIVIVSLNIVWGYPWTGMFAASLTMLVGGFIASTVFRPRAELDVSVPQLAVMGEPFPAEVYVKHHGPFPAFDVTVDRVASRFPSKTPVEICGPGFPLASLTPNDWTPSRLMMVCERRGVHALPPVRLLSTFPFCLFQSEQRTLCSSEIAIAPKSLPEDGDIGSKQFFDRVSRWAQSSFGGDSFDYAGSREYVVGMPVRRWDFRSWARLGRPIVREFQSPARQIANLIVDTSLDPSLDKVESHEQFEWMLRYVATAMEVCNREDIGAQLYVSSEPVDHLISRVERESVQRPLSLLPLATATVTERGIANNRIQHTLDQLLTGPALLFTTRDLTREQDLSLPSRATLIRVGTMPVQSDHSKRRSNPIATWSDHVEESMGTPRELAP